MASISGYLQHAKELLESEQAQRATMLALAFVLGVFPWLTLVQRDAGREAVALYLNAAIQLALASWYLSFVLQRRAWHGRWRGVSRRVLTLPLLAILLSLALNSFTLAYWTLSWDHPSSFSEPLTKVDALYFTLTTFSTTGYGDIHPVAQTARAVVSAQLVIDVLLLTVAAAIAIDRALERDQEPN